MTDTLAVRARGLIKHFGNTKAVDGIDLDIPAGAIYGVLGPNGAGKTTTIRMLATLLPLDGGQATVFGYDVATQGHQVRQLIGLTGQYASVDESMTALENLVLVARLEGKSRSRSQAIAADLLEEFSLVEAANKPLKQFSGGMRRRLDLAVSLIATPPLIFLDEPTTGLDPRTRGQMWDTIRRLVASGSTILLTTQYLDEADELAGRIAVIDRGQVIAEGTSEQLKASVGSTAVRLRVRDRSQLPDAVRIVSLTSGLGEAAILPPDRLSAQVADGDAVADLLIALKQAGIEVAEISMHEPSLDEVFLTLTGRTAADESGSSENSQEVRSA